MKAVSYVHRPPPGRASRLLRRAAAVALRSASAGLSRLARRLRAAEAVVPLHLPVVEFHPMHADGGAPEGALYVDGELVAVVPGVMRL